MRIGAFLVLSMLALLAASCAPEHHYPTIVPISNRAESRLVEELQSDSIVILVQTIAVKEEEKDMLEGLWRSVDESALPGTSKKLWNRNGLRIGLADDRFIEEARRLLDTLGYERTLSYGRRLPPRSVSEIKIGVPQSQKNIFIMPEGRRISAQNYELVIEVYAGAIEEDKLPLTITPVILPGAGQANIELEDLSVTFRCKNFEPIVLGAFAYEVTAAGSAFVFSEGDGPRVEVLMTIYPVFPEQNADSTSEKSIWPKNG